MIDGREIVQHLLEFIENVPEAFPQQYTKSWSPTLSGLFYVLGKKHGCEPRCGDHHRKLAEICRQRGLKSLPEEYAELTEPWNVHGLLDIDVAWVPMGFSIPKNFSELPTPERAEILLAYEHEDEGTMYTDARGTNLNVILDEVRKIGNVRSQVKVLSYFSSKAELDDETHIERICDEIGLIPSAERLTGEWVVVGLAKYERPRSRKRFLLSGSERQLFCKAVRLDKGGKLAWSRNETLKYPI